MKSKSAIVLISLGAGAFLLLFCGGVLVTGIALFLNARPGAPNSHKDGPHPQGAAQDTINLAGVACPRIPLPAAQGTVDGLDAYTLERMLHDRNGETMNRGYWGLCALGEEGFLHFVHVLDTDDFEPNLKALTHLAMGGRQFEPKWRHLVIPRIQAKIRSQWVGVAVAATSRAVEFQYYELRADIVDAMNRAPPGIVESGEGRVDRQQWYRQQLDTIDKARQGGGQ